MCFKQMCRPLQEDRLSTVAKIMLKKKKKLKPAPPHKPPTCLWVGLGPGTFFGGGARTVWLKKATALCAEAEKVQEKPSFEVRVNDGKKKSHPQESQGLMKLPLLSQLSFDSVFAIFNQRNAPNLHFKRLSLLPFRSSAMEVDQIKSDTSYLL